MSVRKWTYENCISEVKKYKDLKDFTKECSGALKAIYKNNWNDILDGIRSVKPAGYWTYDRCEEVTLKYNSISKFRKENGGAYYTINLNNWNHLFDHMKILPNFYKRLIYVYEFDDNSCYVGLTCDIIRRHKQHMDDLNSSVNKYIIETGFSPKLILKSDYIDVRESVKLEDEILKQYKNNGFNILNKNKTGSIGGVNLYWTKERCIEEVKKYKTYSEFRKNSTGAHNSSFKNGWLYEILDIYIPGYKKRKSPN
jgi:predicted GIY-YIG superfamily endonuclease